MTKRVVFHVLPHAQGGWSIKKEGNERAVSKHATKDVALARAKELAKAQPAGQVIFHKRDGTIQREHTYVSDPRASKG